MVPEAHSCEIVSASLAACCGQRLWIQTLIRSFAPARVDSFIPLRGYWLRCAVRWSGVFPALALDAWATLRPSGSQLSSFLKRGKY